MNKFNYIRRIAKNGPLGPSIVFATVLVISMGLNSQSFASESAETLQDIEMTVYKAENCGCCSKWVEHLEENGFEVDVRTITDTASVKKRIGVPRHLGSCHTAVVGDYWVEGHVPADLIHKLLREQPKDIEGIATPGMPLGSPGMESPNPQHYEIVSFDSEGNVEVYATRMGETDQ